MLTDTVFAPATAPGRGGVSVIRVSGPDAFSACEKLCKIPVAGKFRLSKVLSVDGVLLDVALILAFEKGASFTGEKTVEIQCHGSVAVVDAICTALRSIGLRDAEAGEFTRRALENGQLSLIEVEALGDLIDAETEQQRRQAVLAFGGDLSAVIESWRSDLNRSIALAEATIDFSDEEIPSGLFLEVEQLLEATLISMQAVLDRSAVAEKVRSGRKVAIVGKPNVGKSTLLNAIAGSDVAITSDIAGTTRDVVTVRVNLHGSLVEFGDTAGLRDTVDRIEKIGIARAKSYAKDADLRVFLMDPADQNTPELMQDGDIRVFGKGDLLPSPESLSGLTGEGVEGLLDRVSDALSVGVSTDVVLIRDRQRAALAGCINHIKLSCALLRDGDGMIELIVDEVYQARRALDFLLGRLDVESVLGEIFSSFCVGK